MSQKTQPRLSSHTQQHTTISQTSTHRATVTKRKKKKKNIPSSSVSAEHVGVTGSSSQTASDNSNATESSDHSSSNSASSTTLDLATTEQWQQRVQSLRTALNKAQKENQILVSDLAAALARASDAEHAEDAVNKGLLTARSVISQRDRAIAELKSTASSLRVDLSQLQAEKKKIEKRLVLLKTVCANLQEARETRDAAEKKLDEANIEISVLKEQKDSLGNDIESLKLQVEAMEMVKQQLARREIEVDELTRAHQRVEGDIHQRAVHAFGVGAISVLAIGVLTRLLGRGRVNDRE